MTLPEMDVEAGSHLSLARPAGGRGGLSLVRFHCVYVYTVHNYVERAVIPSVGVYLYMRSPTKRDSIYKVYCMCKCKYCLLKVHICFCIYCTEGINTHVYNKHTSF
jgi:hypothetical protein